MQPFEKKKLKYQSKDSPNRTFQEIKLKANLYFADDHKQRDAKSFLIVKSVVLFLLLFATYYLLLHTHYIPKLFLFYILFGWIFLIIGINLGHDAAHHCVTGNRKVDSLLFQIIFGLQGLSGYLWQIRHNNSHHIFPNVFDYDTDLEITKLIILNPNQNIKWYHQYQYIYAPFVYMTFSISWIFYQDFVLMFQKQHANLKMGKIPVVEIFKLLLVKIIYIILFLVIPIIYSPISAAWIFLAFILMHFVV